MAELSTAAQAVMDAFTRGNPVLVTDPVYREVCAAALQAVADQVAPIQRLNGSGFRQHRSATAECLAIRRELLAIATELENTDA